MDFVRFKRIETRGDLNNFIRASPRQTEGVENVTAVSGGGGRRREMGQRPMFPFSRYAFSLSVLHPSTDRFPFPRPPWAPACRPRRTRNLSSRRRLRVTGFNQRNIGAGPIYMQKRNTPSSINGRMIHFVRHTYTQTDGTLKKRTFFSLPSRGTIK